MRRRVAAAFIVMVLVGTAIVAARSAPQSPPQSPPQAAQQAPPQTPAATVDYDTFMKAAVQARLQEFNKLSPENRALLVRTHIGRWLEANRTRLSPAQVEVMQQNLDAVSADAYRPNRTPAVFEKARALQMRTSKLFTTKDIQQALTIQGDYLPPPDKK